jgi:hypothetical protein
LEAALAYYREFIEQRRDDPTARAELESTRERVKAILANLAVMQGAWRHLILGESSVQEDLHLSAEQRKRIADVLDDIPSRRPKPVSALEENDADRSEKLIDEIKRHEREITDILTPGQLHRLNQIALQLQGMRAFSDPDVVAALSLTKDQEEQLRAIDQPPRFDAPNGAPPGEPPPEAGSSRTASHFEEIREILTGEQLRKWKEMTGGPFGGNVRSFFPGGPMPPPTPRQRPHGTSKNPTHQPNF